MEIVTWLDSMKNLLEKLPNIDLGYPIGTIKIESPCNPELLTVLCAETGTPSTATILKFYTLCNGITLDVHNGYFIHSLELILRGIEQGEPTKILGEYPRNIFVFGSDGGGNTFAFDTQSQEVVYLPLGEVRQSLFTGTAEPIKVLGQDFTAFLDRLQSDIEAIVTKNPRHHFMV